MALLAETRRRHELPDNHLTSFGDVGLLTGLILAHFKATDERVPLNTLWTRTDTRNADGNRLKLGNFDENGLNCDNWNWDDNRNDNLRLSRIADEHETADDEAGTYGSYA